MDSHEGHKLQGVACVHRINRHDKLKDAELEKCVKLRG
jgi:hypothetical protein